MTLSTTSERGLGSRSGGTSPPPDPAAAWPSGSAAAGLVATVATVVTAAGRIGESAVPRTSSVSSGSVVADPHDMSGIAELEQRTATEPDDVRAWQELSRRYLQQAVSTGDPSFYDLTRRALDRRLPRARRGRHHRDRGRSPCPSTTSPALEHGRAAHEQVAEDPDPLAILVDASVELGRYDEAEDHLAELLVRRPGSAALAPCRTS